MALYRDQTIPEIIAKPGNGFAQLLRGLQSSGTADEAALSRMPQEPELSPP